MDVLAADALKKSRVLKACLSFFSTYFFFARAFKVKRHKKNWIIHSIRTYNNIFLSLLFHSYATGKKKKRSNSFLWRSKDDEKARDDLQTLTQMWKSSLCRVSE